MVCVAWSSLCETVANTDVVFEGTVESVTDRRVRFRDVTRWKGVARPEVLNSNGLSGYDYQFEVGARYLVSAHSRVDGALETSICSYNRPIAEAGEMLAYLRTMPDIPSGARISGTVSVTGGPFGNSPFELVAGAPVQLTGPMTRSMTTGVGGDYLFDRLEPGEYAVSFAPPAHRRDLVADAPPHKITLRDSLACATVDGEMTINGRIDGSVRTTTDRPAVGAVVQLRPADVLNGVPEYLTVETDAGGRYSFGQLLPGRYVLGVNLEVGLTTESPFAMAYSSAPGSLAPQVIVLGHAEAMRRPTIVIRVPAFILVGGTVRDPLGPRVGNVEITADSRGEIFGGYGGNGGSTTTDGEGHFVLALREGTRYTIRALSRDLVGEADVTANTLPVIIDMKKRR